MSRPWILSIDFGTSYTLVAAKVGDRAPEVVEIGGDRRMPSVVMVEAAGDIVVGRTADDLSGSNPTSTLRAPKNRLGDQAPVVLDGRPYQVVQLVAALLRTVYDEAVGQMGGPPSEVRLTHPATWNRPRLNRLIEAATKAGLPNPALVPEPVAAALTYATDVGVPDGGHLLVYDLGGGTFDTAVVTSRRGGFVVEGRPGGDQNIGGELFDELVMNHVGAQLDADDWEQIQVAVEPRWQQMGASLRKEARRAKETLSSHPYADLLVPLPDGLAPVRITRDEFEQIVGPYIDETVTLLRRCVNDAGVDESAVRSIYLVGGASRSPIVERTVKAAFPTIAVSRRGDPKTSVALGAARAVRSGTAPVLLDDGTTQEASPVTGEQPLAFGPPPSPVPSPAPSAGTPSVRPPPPPPSSAPPTVAVAAPMVAAPVVSARKRRRMTPWVIGAGALAALAALAGAALVIAGGDDDSHAVELAGTTETTEVLSTTTTTTATTAAPTTSAPVSPSTTTAPGETTVAPAVPALTPPPETTTTTTTAVPPPGPAETPTVPPAPRAPVGYPVVAASAAATCQSPNGAEADGTPIVFDPNAAVDGDPVTAWRCPGDAIGEQLTIELAGPVRVTSVGLVPGYDKVDPTSGADRFYENRRVRSVAWWFDDGTRIVQDFADSRELQTIPVDGIVTTSATIEILDFYESAYPLGHPQRREFVAISDVQLEGTGA